MAHNMKSFFSENLIVSFFNSDTFTGIVSLVTKKIPVARARMPSKEKVTLSLKEFESTNCVTGIYNRSA